MIHNEFLSLPDVARDALERQAMAVRNVVPESTMAWQLDVSSLPDAMNDSTLLDEVRHWAGEGDRFIYYFEFQEENNQLGLVEQAYKAAREHAENARCYARRNLASRRIYVGSSQKIHLRLAEHLGYRSAKTYALHFIHWARPLGLNLNFVCAKYAGSVDLSVIQSLEDALWTASMPMFGRQGRK